MRIKIELLRAEDDPSPRDSTLQTEFKIFGSKLDKANIKHTQRGIAFDGGGALGYPLGQFILDFTSTIQPILTAAVAGWFYSRRGRKVSVTLDNGMKFVASSPEEMRKLLDAYYETLRDR